MSPKIGTPRCTRDRSGDRSCILNECSESASERKNQGAMVLSMASATQLPLNTSVIAYTKDMYEPHSGREISCRRRNPRSPLRPNSSLFVIRHAEKWSAQRSHRPSATARRGSSQSDDHNHQNHLPEVIALIVRLECAPFRIRFFFVDVIRTATSPEYLRNVFSSDVTAPSVTQKTCRTL